MVRIASNSWASLATSLQFTTLSSRRATPTASLNLSTLASRFISVNSPDYNIPPLLRWPILHASQVRDLPSPCAESSSWHLSMDSPADNAPPEPALEPHDPPVNLPLHDQQSDQGGDESLDNTVTAAQHTTPDLAAPNGHSYIPASPEHPRPSTSYSDTGFNRPYSSDHNGPSHGYHNFSPPSDQDTPPRYQNNGSRPLSRPSSGMAYTHSDAGSRTYQEQNQRGSQQGMTDKQNTSVVIKVGMVGDAQIGKTSLMVKYVEGSWDEDYIQTLGMQSSSQETRESMAPPSTDEPRRG